MQLRMRIDELWMLLSEAQALQSLRAGGFALLLLTNKIERIPSFDICHVGVSVTIKPDALILTPAGKSEIEKTL